MKYVVIGASAAGISGAKTLRELDKDAEIILISKDTEVYSRCILHHYLEGKRDIKALDFTEKDYFNKFNIKWIKGVEVTSLNPNEHILELSSGERIDYDKVLISSGASSFIPPIENLREANNVVGLRNIEDAVLIKEKTKTLRNVVVLGAGLVGIDAVSGIISLGANVTVVEMMNRILTLQLDAHASKEYEKRFIEKGVNFKFGVRAEKLIIDDNNNPKELLLNTGEKIPCEFIVVTAGVRSNVGFLKDSGVETDKFGLIINEKGETNTKDVYGAGDVTGRNPIWPTATKEGIIAAYNMTGRELLMTDFFGSKNTMSFVNLPTLSLGMVEKEDDTYKEEIEINENGYKKIIHKEGKIYGAVIQGDLSYAGVLTQLIKEKIDVSKVKKPLFEIDYADFFNLRENQEYTY
ncbi:NAD(P)/FAD-dependent oxidoreductase [Clostridium sp.]|uniref:NAD(P)/FAD-dependent oxidoreductase n=1 Tax=Clostridium sp. TaxID=1506 RepID=UPI003F3B6543